MSRHRRQKWQREHARRAAHCASGQRPAHRRQRPTVPDEVPGVRCYICHCTGPARAWCSRCGGGCERCGEENT